MRTSQDKLLSKRRIKISVVVCDPMRAILGLAQIARHDVALRGYTQNRCRDR